ncbi:MULTISPECIES: alanine/glycine:cation symporter family protein [Marinobacter]|jgi:AGCS family alanine or glycine:cation symporter|uniref:Sodium:alanine symporter family protein n=1 Tax=Marinobacter nauticus TaxID=2743 RepID=A0A833NB77_MARNT|nr:MULTISPECIES: sodium:alanine symporter family protein [Marinobacter]MEC8822533.1 sodium:alanine symporter family protein [Pseudomonadota bacterium]KAE8547567.1 Sodium:alanine symporter family protein [Marinobacter nauticus]MAC23983.1 sodium:alanine symporter family protein [Marinobacter sp.]MAL33406.1 sodium:alanine symporter family protein [Marinobacter sp.]MCS5560895.1 sodium:alanine symporter family protein [Marinobacter nauticus]|tara:strand:- start:3543 stop:4955 length:1413 start_codon:yes stop_codon:yes gene_type:complete
MTAIVDFLNSILWGYVLVYGLLAVGVFFTIRLGFLQFVNFGEMVRAIRGSRESDVHGISPFQALCTSLASRVGTGNLAGVAVALYLGGAGAIFWMWMVALVGMATGYAESTLAQLYKVRDGKGQYRGGPAVYIAKGLKAPWAAAIFAVCLIISFGLVFNAVQANSIADAMQGAFGAPKLGVGVVIAAFAGIVIFGGLRKIVRFAEFVVPFMAGAYVLLALGVMALNITEVPGILALIVKSAFGLEEAAGGAAGSVTAAMLNGIKRGLFSNEAGMGSAPNIAATATPAPHHPSSQGLVQAFGVFIDTIIVCTATAVMILLAGVLEPGSGVTGTQLTQQAMEVHLGEFGGYFIAIAILFFAFTSIVANYTYAENALIYLRGGNTLGLTLLRLAALGMVIWGGYEAVVTVFNAADASMGLMATINLIAIVLLSGTVVKLTKDYLAQRKEGLVPHFKSKDYPELHEKIDSNIWH